MTIVGGRLYAGSYNATGGAGYINIWDNISTVTAAKNPDVTLTASSNLGSVVHVEVTGNVLVAAVADPLIVPTT